MPVEGSQAAVVQAVCFGNPGGHAYLDVSWIKLTGI